MPKTPEHITISSDDEPPQLMGWRGPMLNPTNEDGITYTGYLRPDHPSRSVQGKKRKASKAPSSKEVIVIEDSDSDIQEISREDVLDREAEDEYAATVPVENYSYPLVLDDLSTDEDEAVPYSINNEALSNAYTRLHTRTLARTIHGEGFFDSWTASLTPLFSTLRSERLTTVMRSGGSIRPNSLKHARKCTFPRAKRVIGKCPGDVNTIVQSADMVVIASSVSGGGLNDHDDAYNREGSLSVWDHSKLHLLHGHSRGSQHFTVNDVALDPAYSRRFISAGRDHKVILWQLDEHGSVSKLKEVECEDNPEVVKFHPSSERLVAVQCNNGSVLLLHPHDSLELAGRRPLVVAHPKHHHFTADMVWGVEASRNHLFASSASHDSGFEGFHKAFDIVTRKEVARFNAGGEACCTLALETSGKSLFVVSEKATDASENPKAAYTLRVFEASKLNSRPAQTVELEPFLAPFDRDRTYSDVNSMSVSPDGLYVALGRTDNWTDVYDTRMLTKGPLRSFGHEGEIEPESAETEGSSLGQRGGHEGEMALGGSSSGHEDGTDPMRKRITTYGIVKTQWVNGPPYGYGLVTGGIDGDVRLWDIKRAADDPLNGRVLAHGDSDVATFCLGDVSKGEIPIILGQRSGEVITYEMNPRED